MTATAGNITFMFTDIEGSTRLLQDLGERYHALLNEHHALMREVIGANEGTVVSTEGDAFFAAFPSAVSAVRAAGEAQTRFAAHEWPDGIPLRVRMGLHTGEAEIVGDNYGGIDVHTAARIASAAHGGQVLLSAVTKAAAERRLPTGMSIRYLGEHRLKDLDRPEHLFQLCIPNLQADFPPPRALGARPNNLPEQLSSFVGRERELGEINALVASSRLVTLTGPGGTGKTRLSIAAGREMLGSFRDGVWVVWLAPVVDPDLVPSTIARAIGLREDPRRPPLDSLKQHVADKEILLILDNFEQILDAAPPVAQLLAVAPRLKVLATSRAALNISGEQEYPVPSLVVPDPARIPSRELASHYEAVALFVERARAVKPSFELTEDNVTHVVQICARLDGLPLALELAAARVKLLSPKQIAERLESGLSLLVAGRRDVPARQQTLRNAIAWSYDLLAEQEQLLFRRLGIFRGGWTYEAAEAVCNPESELGIDTLEGVESLIGHSLVRQYETEEAEARIRMLQTIREFALEQLGVAGELEEMRRRHARFFFEHAQRAAPTLTTDDTTVWQLEREHDNLRAVLEWSLDAAEITLGVELAAALWRFWQFRNHLAEARKWLDELVARSGDCPPDVTARGLMALGSIVYWQEQYDQAIDYYKKGLDLFRRADDRAGVTEALYNLGWLGAVVGDFTMAQETLEEALAMHRETGDEHGIATIATALGITKVRKRELDEAERFGEEGARLFAKIGDWWGEALAYFVLAQAARFRGDLVAALRYALRDVELLEKSSGMAGMEGMFGLFGQLLIQRGDVAAGLRLAASSEARREEAGGGAPASIMELDDPRQLAQGLMEPDEIVAHLEAGRQLTVDETLAELKKAAWREFSDDAG